MHPLHSIMILMALEIGQDGDPLFGRMRHETQTPVVRNRRPAQEPTRSALRV